MDLKKKLLGTILAVLMVVAVLPIQSDAYSIGGTYKVRSGITFNVWSSTTGYGFETKSDSNTYIRVEDTKKDCAIGDIVKKTSSGKYVRYRYYVNGSYAKAAIPNRYVSSTRVKKTLSTVKKYVYTSDYRPIKRGYYISTITPKTGYAKGVKCTIQKTHKTYYEVRKLTPMRNSKGKIICYKESSTWGKVYKKNAVKSGTVKVAYFN